MKIWITDQASVGFYFQIFLIASILTIKNLCANSPLLSIMNRNIRLNGLEGSVAVAELNWLVISLLAKDSKRGPEIRSRGSPIPANIPRPDIILAADCVYFEPAFPLLVQILSDLSDSTTDVLFCYKKRRKVRHLPSLTFNPSKPSVSTGRQTVFHDLEKEICVERGEEFCFIKVCFEDADPFLCGGFGRSSPAHLQQRINYDDKVV